MQIGKSEVRLIGDPHLGRKFITGVPLHRRGEREALQERKFKAELSETPPPTVIVMGDLFDQFKVDNETLLKAFVMFAQAAYANPTTTYLVLQGNHDVSRDKDATSSFDILSRMLSGVSNIEFVTEPYSYFTKGQDWLLLLPYDAFTPASEVAKIALRLNNFADFKAAFGHWDVEEIAGTHNLIPTAELSSRVKQVFTGHVHNRGVITRDGVEVVITGSLLPYAHGEDKSGEVYVTLTLEEFQKDPTKYHDKAVRLLLKHGEDPPVEFDALQLTYKYMDETEVEVEVKSDNFCFKEIFDSTMMENDVPVDVIKSVWDRYQEINRDA